MPTATLESPARNATQLNPSEAEQSAPRTAMQVGGGRVSLALETPEGVPTDLSASVPVTLVARSSDPIDHWWWGMVVHDFAGMRRHRDRAVIDYCHDDDQVIGWFEGHEITERGLELTGELTPVGDFARCRDVLDKMRAGVPYEASIQFDEQRLVVEHVLTGASAEANGRTYEGPVTILRQWNLRGVAVCPHGYDAQTDTAALAQGATPACFRLSQTSPPSPTMEPEAPETDAPQTQDAPKTTADAPTGDEGSTPTPPEGVAEFVSAFGEADGCVYFGRGLTLTAAHAAHATKLTAELKTAREEIASLKSAPAGKRSGNALSLSATGGEGTPRKSTFSIRKA